MSANNSGPAEVPARWRFAAGRNPGLLPPPRAPVEGALGGADLDRAWHLLLINHTPFQPVDEREYARVVDRYRELEELVLGDPELQGYYAESFLTEDAAKAWANEGNVVDGPVPGWKLHHVATLQSQLMEDAFYAFRLDRYANAQDNRGWMNLFRRWGNSATFKARFESMRETFSRDFVDFFDYYVRDLPPIDTDPIPHPWDPGTRREDKRSERMLSEDDLKWSKLIRPQPAAVKRYFPGVYLDSGIREATPEKLQPPHPSTGEHGAEPDKPSPPAAPPPISPEGGSASGPGAVPNQ
jgi:hypothetical protein